MPQGWKTFVYQTDVEPTKFRGFFFDDKAAQTWVDKQAEGVFEVSDKKPTDVIKKVVKDESPTGA